MNELLDSFVLICKLWSTVNLKCISICVLNKLSNGKRKLNIIQQNTKMFLSKAESRVNGDFCSTMLEIWYHDNWRTIYEILYAPRKHLHSSIFMYLKWQIWNARNLAMQLKEMRSLRYLRLYTFHSNSTQVSFPMRCVNHTKINFIRYPNWYGVIDNIAYWESVSARFKLSNEQFIGRWQRRKFLWGGEGFQSVRENKSSTIFIHPARIPGSATYKFNFHLT